MDVVRKTAKMDLAQLNSDWIFTTAWTDRVEHGANIQEIERYYCRRQGGRG